MRFMRHSLIGVFLTAATVGLLLYAGVLIRDAVEARLSDEPRRPPARERIFAVRIIEAQAEAIAPELSAFGRIESRRTLELRTAQRGRVLELSPDFQDGGWVEAGAVLVRIDPADAEAGLSRAKADLMDAEAEQRDAGRGLILANDELQAAEDQANLRRQAYQRQIDLERRGVGTAATVETAALAAAQARQSVISRRQAVRQAEARVDQAATRVLRAEVAQKIASRDLADTTIRAAFSGSLQAVSLVEGRLVSANEKLAELVDPDQLEVAFRVSTVQYARLLKDSGRLIDAPVRVTLDAAGAALTTTGQLSRASGGVGDGQTGRLIYARLDAAPGFKPGDFVSVAVTEPALENVVRLPASAYGSDGAVLVLGPEDRLQSVPVQLLRRQGDDVLLRAEALLGRSVVAGRTPLLGPGIKVRPLQDDARAAGGVPDQQSAMIELSHERRARLVAFVEGNTRIPEAARQQTLTTLSGDKVPAQLVNRLEARMGG